MNRGKLVSVGTVARLLGVSRPSVRSYIAEEVFPGAFQLPSGHWRIPLAEVEALLSKQPKKPAWARK